VVKVLNKRLNQHDGVYIGRPSVFGNPFEIGKDGNRKEVIEKYKSYLESRPDLIEKAKNELKGKDLVCWCAPLPCHGDILLKIANE
jgi:hypothetical protein